MNRHDIAAPHLLGGRNRTEPPPMVEPCGGGSERTGAGANVERDPDSCGRGRDTALAALQMRFAGCLRLRM